METEEEEQEEEDEQKKKEEDQKDEEEMAEETAQTDIDVCVMCPGTSRTALRMNLCSRLSSKSRPSTFLLLSRVHSLTCVHPQRPK